MKIVWPAVGGEPAPPTSRTTSYRVRKGYPSMSMRTGLLPPATVTVPPPAVVTQLAGPSETVFAVKLRIGVWTPAAASSNPAVMPL